MANTASLPVNSLTLDLNNFRTVPQASENDAIQAMIAISPDRFWALMESLIEDGYLPTETIIVLRTDSPASRLTVKEGNRRVAALKLIMGYLPQNLVVIPEPILTKIKHLSDDWLELNNNVPCAVYEESEAQAVDKIVTLAHGKNEKAGRDQWNAVARARHNRHVNKAKEHALNLLDKFLEHDKNITLLEKERWAGNYPLSVLEEAMKRIAARVGVKNAPELAAKYPHLQYKESVDKILRAIGRQDIGFEEIRSSSFGTDYGIPALALTKSPTESKKNRIIEDEDGGETVQLPLDIPPSAIENSNSENAVNGELGSPLLTPDYTAGAASGRSTVRKVTTVSLRDPKSVRRALKSLKLSGQNRKKVATLRDEAVSLDLNKNPLAFCFILRSMFEISAKAYCDDHSADNGPKALKSDGTSDRYLVDILKDVYHYMVKKPDGKQDLFKVRALHGAYVELTKSEGILSVTSMNQLIHNTSFSVSAHDICIVFSNIFPLLEEMNR